MKHGIPGGGEAAVGANSSRPPPQRSEAKRVSIPRPPQDYQINLLNPIIAPDTRQDKRLGRHPSRGGGCGGCGEGVLAPPGVEWGNRCTPDDLALTEKPSTSP